MGKRSVGKTLNAAAKSTRVLRSATKATAQTAGQTKTVLKRTRRVRSSTGAITKPVPKGKIHQVTISAKKYPESAKHIRDAQKAGHPKVLTADRTNAKANRRASLRGKPKVKGKDLDEYPFATTKEGGAGASVRPIAPGDNRGSGSSMGHQIRGLPNGAKFEVKVVP